MSTKKKKKVSAAALERAAMAVLEERKDDLVSAAVEYYNALVTLQDEARTYDDAVKEVVWVVLTELWEAEELDDDGRVKKSVA